ncbi:MAG: hypothetical protein WD187_01190 [Candidatus Woykebacteria bacterium]
MPPYPTQLLKSAKGISFISVIIIFAVIFAGLNAYAYFNPEFQLNKLSFVYYLREFNDNQRKDDLNKIAAAVEKYYDENGEYPAKDGWCGRVLSVLHPEVKDAISGYFSGEGIPQDPSFRGTGEDYFYRRQDRKTFILLAKLENPPFGSPTYNYSGCYDWPGNDLFNYRVVGSH